MHTRLASSFFPTYLSGREFTQVLWNISPRYRSHLLMLLLTNIFLFALPYVCPRSEEEECITIFAFFTTWLSLQMRFVLACCCTSDARQATDLTHVSPPQRNDSSHEKQTCHRTVCNSLKRWALILRSFRSFPHSEMILCLSWKS